MAALIGKLLSISSAIHRIELLWKITLFFRENLPLILFICKTITFHSYKVLTHLLILLSILLFYVYFYHPEMWNFILTYCLKPAPEQSLQSMVLHIANNRFDELVKTAPFTDVVSFSTKKDIAFNVLVGMFTFSVAFIAFKYF